MISNTVCFDLASPTSRFRDTERRQQVAIVADNRTVLQRFCSANGSAMKYATKYKICNETVATVRHGNDVCCRCRYIGDTVEECHLNGRRNPEFKRSTVQLVVFVPSLPISGDNDVCCSIDFPFTSVRSRHWRHSILLRFPSPPRPAAKQSMRGSLSRDAGWSVACWSALW